MGVISFLIGLGIGVLILLWHHDHSTRKMKKLLSSLRPEVADIPFSATSQLSLAIAYQQKLQTRVELQLATYKQILNLAPIGFLFVDEENQLLWCNPAARHLLRMPHDADSEPRLLLELVRSYELDTLIENTRHLQKPCQRDWTFYPYNPDPTRISKQRSYALRGYSFPLPDNKVGIFIENRQEAIALMQQRDRWASDVAHELKTPLTSIRLVAETLQSRLEGPLQGWTERLISQTNRLTNLVQDLLELGTLEQDVFESLNLSNVDLVDLLHSAWNNLEPLSRGKNLKLEYEGPEQLVVFLDEVRFYRVLVNLFDNSIKYSPPWGVIYVHLYTEEPDPQESSRSSHAMICLDIIDAGPGFSDDDLPHVFERFYRADSSRTRQSDTTSRLQERSPTPSSPDSSKPSSQSSPLHRKTTTSSSKGSSQGSSQGSGLGLSIVQQIVEAHRGTVSAKNHPETGGAWLQVQLPQYTTQDVRSLSPSSPPLPSA